MTEQAEPAEETRCFLGVTDSGLRIGTKITGCFLGEPRPIPMSAVSGGMDAITRDRGIFGRLLVADGSPLLWPVSAEVYREFHEIDQDEVPELLDAVERLCSAVLPWVDADSTEGQPPTEWNADHYREQADELNALRERVMALLNRIDGSS